MKKRPSQIERGRQFRIARPWLFLVVVVVLLAAGGLTYELTLPKNTHYQGPAVNSQSPTPAPGQAGNPGDVAKEDQSQAPTPSPTPSAAATSAVTVSSFNVTPQGGGVVRVQNDQVTGASSGTCTLSLTSPNGDQDQTAAGQLVYSGTYYSCSFSSISGVNETGTWTAGLSVTNSSGASGKATDTTFEVN